MYKSSSFAAIIIILSTQRIRGNLIEINPLCISSSSRPYEINTTSFSGTLKEGKCFVACLDRYQVRNANIFNLIIFCSQRISYDLCLLLQKDIMNRDFIRPFPVINETAGCLPHLDKVWIGVRSNMQSLPLKCSESIINN